MDYMSSFMDDPIAKSQVDAPLQQAQRMAPPPMAPQEPGAVEQLSNMAKQRAMTGALNAGETGLIEGAKTGYNKLAGMMATPAAPSAAQMSGLTELATASGGGLSPGAAQAVLGSGQAAAPLVGQAAGMTGAQLAGTTGAQLATSAGTSAAAAGAGGMAALGAAVPYIGAGLLAGKALGFFNSGGHVGPLYASKGRKAVEGESIKDQLYPLLMDKYIEEQDKINNEIEQSRYKYGGGMAGPLSKVEYKSAGGEVYKLFYGGPISKGA